MIVAVCSDKGSPGVTTLATALALAWPGDRLVLEADPSGGDLSLRTRAPGLEYLAREPTVLNFAMAVRAGAHGDGLDAYAQESSAGVLVVAGPPVVEGWAPLQHLWSQVAERVTEWPGTVIADLGRLQPGHPGFALVQAADAVVVLCRPTVDGLLRTRERVQRLQQALDGGGEPTRVGVAVRAGARDRRAMSEVQQVLAGAVPVVGGFADDPEAVQLLWQSPESTELRASALLRSAHELSGRIRRLWPGTQSPVLEPDARSWPEGGARREGAVAPETPRQGLTPAPLRDRGRRSTRRYGSDDESGPFRLVSGDQS